jgi:rsbT antagonist protein RsbS
MTSTIIKLGSNLIALIRPVAADVDLTDINLELSKQVGQHGSRGVILDLSAMDVIDSYSTRLLLQISQTLRLRGAETVIVGIQPDVAFAMVQMGLTLETVSVALDVEDGLAMLAKRTEASERHAL